MALVVCSECGKEISDKALTCIGCGAPIGTSDSEKNIVATRSSFDQKSEAFNGTKQLMARLAVQAVVDVGWRVDSADEASGLVSFTTGMTWGSFSGVSGTIVISEMTTGKFSVTGAGKQNVRGGQMIAPNLFNEANKKVAKVIEQMKLIASRS